jgi:hypothetical protein
MEDPLFERFTQSFPARIKKGDYGDHDFLYALLVPQVKLNKPRFELPYVPSLLEVLESKFFYYNSDHFVCQQKADTIYSRSVTKP